MQNQKISLIVPMKGDADYFPACLESLTKITYQPLDIYLVDDGMGSRALETAARFNEKIKIIRSDGNGPSYARNLAAKITDAEILAFTDSDCLVESDCLDNLKTCLDRFPDAAGCGGIQLLPEDSNDFEKKVFVFLQKSGFLSEYVRESSDKILKVEHNASCNVVYKRKAFLEVGGFPEDLWPGEDVELDYKLIRKGYKLYFNSQAKVYHYRPKDISAFIRMMFRYGYAQGHLVKKYGFWRKVQLMPLAAFLFLIFSALLFSAGQAWLVFIFLFIICALVFFVAGFKWSIFQLAFFAYVYWNCGFIRGWIKK